MPVDILPSLLPPSLSPLSLSSPPFLSPLLSPLLSLLPPPLPLSFPPPPPPRLINTMLVVDPQRRASLEQVAGHPWLQVGHEEDPDPVPAVADVKELPDDEVELILSRMVQGGYGTEEEIIG